MSDVGKSSVSSSMIELKAELFRRQEELKNRKVAETDFSKRKTSEKNSIWNRRKKEIPAAKEKPEKDCPDETEEEENALLKSRKALEKKAELYDKITSSSSIPEEDGSLYYLVDFQKKAVDSIVEERRKEEDQAVDDREHFMVPSQDVVPTALRLGGESGKDDKELESMYREKMRKKWEDEEASLLEQEEIHYSNVQFDENRTHGVGFYQFSKDKESRTEEMENLKKLREETLNQQSRKDKIKDKRKAIMEARLAKVRQRRGLKEEVSEKAVENEEKPEEPQKSEATDTVIEEEIKKMREESEKAEQRKAHVREWDQGKQPGPSIHHNYLVARREEREPEFAPPSLYFKSSGTSVSGTTPSKTKVAAPSVLQTKDIHVIPAGGNVKSGKNQELQESVDVSSISLPPPLPKPADSTAELHCRKTDDLEQKPNVNSMGTQDYHGTVSPQYPVYSHEQYASLAQQVPYANPTQEVNYVNPTYSDQYVNPIIQEEGSWPQYQQVEQYAYISGQQQSDYYYQNQQSFTGNEKNENRPLLTPNPDYSNSSSEPSFKRSVATAASTDQRRNKIPKTAIVDTRYVQGDSDPLTLSSDSDDIFKASIPSTYYTPGSFTAAKQALMDMSEDAVIHSRSQNQISGGPLLYNSVPKQEEGNTLQLENCDKNLS